jgi:hypothetical protein
VVQFLVAVCDDIFQDGQEKEMLTLILLSSIIPIERKQLMRERPIGVTILAILAGVAAVLAAIHALQFLGIFPFIIGPAGYKVHYFSFFSALMYGILVWIYIWLVQMLWRVEPQAWMFLVFITVFELMLDFFSMLGSSTWEDVSVSFIVCLVILLYCMLPGVRRAFGTAR